MKTHDNQKPFQCTVCNRGYSTAAALTSHMQNHHKRAAERANSPQISGPSYKCLQCTQIFRKPDELQVGRTISEFLTINYTAFPTISGKLFSRLRVHLDGTGLWYAVNKRGWFCFRTTQWDVKTSVIHWFLNSEFNFHFKLCIPGYSIIIANYL